MDWHFVDFARSYGVLLNTALFMVQDYFQENAQTHRKAYSPINNTVFRCATWFGYALSNFYKFLVAIVLALFVT